MSISLPPPPGNPPTRRRRTPEDARSEAIASARRLLLDKGPAGVTLKAVADELGMSHGNLIHHFGSAAALQSALMGAMVRDLADALEGAVDRIRADDVNPRQMVDIVFDAFDEGGAGRLAAWISLSDNLETLDPVRDAVHDLIDVIQERIDDEEGARDEPPPHIASAMLFITFCAFGDALIGSELRGMLGRDRDAVRRIAAHLLPNFL